MTMRWEKVQQRGGSGGPGVRWGHTCNAIAGGKLLYVFGGYGKDQCQTNQVHVFNTANMLWSEPVIKGTPPTPRDSHSCTTVGDRLFVFGGTDGRRPLNDLHILDTTSNTWVLPSVRGDGPEPREGHSAALIGKRLFIFGGCGKSENSETYYDDLYILDTEASMWKRLFPSGTPPSKRVSHTCSSWRNKIIVIGGEDSSNYYLSDVHILDADTLVWCKLNTTGQLLPPRGGHTTIGFGKNLFVFGGFSDEQNLFDDVYRLDIENGTWIKVTAIGGGPSGRFSMAGESLDPEMGGVLVFVGGCNKNLEALDDMYYLHTGLSSEVDRDERRNEKLSMRKQLKLKCQEQLAVTPEYDKAPFGTDGDDTTIYQPMPISSFMPSGGVEIDLVFNHLSMDDTENVLGQLLAASNSSTLTEALECLIETAKSTKGRSDLASMHILVPVLKLCQSPLKLSAQDLFLSVKLLRNLCAGEIKNQDLFIEQNGVGILLTLINSMGLTSGSDNRALHMVLQLLGNVSLAGEQHRSIVWCQFFPLGFLDIGRVKSKETCGTLCMIIHTCIEGSNERFVELLVDSEMDIIVEIIRTVTVAGFREDWVKLLLSKTCFQKSYFSSIFSKLSPLVEAQNSDDNDSQINHFGAEQLFLLSILSEILNDQIGDIVVSHEFSLCIFGILRATVGIVDFSTRRKSPLPTGSSDTDVMGYTLSILRDISASDSSKAFNQDETGDIVNMLVLSGLIKFLIMLLRNLEPPAIIKKAMVHNETKDEGTTSQASKYYCPYRGFRRDIVAIIGNCSYRKKHVQDEIREQDGILLLLQQCVTDEDNPFLREWGIWSMRNVFEGNQENQRLVADLELQESVDVPDIADLGLRVEVDPKTRRPKLVNVS